MEFAAEGRRRAQSCRLPSPAVIVLLPTLADVPVRGGSVTRRPAAGLKLRGPCMPKKIPPLSTSGWDFSLILLQKPLSCGSDGTSMHCRVVVFPAVIGSAGRFFIAAEPQRNAAMRADSSVSAYRPWVSRQATKRSERSFTRTGGHSFSGSSPARRAGIQYRRNRLPIGAPGPIRVTSSFCSRVSI